MTTKIASPYTIQLGPPPGAEDLPAPYWWPVAIKEVPLPALCALYRRYCDHLASVWHWSDEPYVAKAAMMASQELIRRGRFDLVLSIERVSYKDTCGGEPGPPWD